MNIGKKSLAIGALIVTTGIITAGMAYAPSKTLQYIFIVSSSTVGVIALLIGRQTKKSFVRSKYFTWIGFTSVVMAISVGIWATTLGEFINVVGFFLLALGIIEFVFVMQIISFETPLPWKRLALKLVITIVTTVGAAWTLTMAGIDVNVALFFSGGFLVLVGLSFIQLSRMKRIA